MVCTVRSARFIGTKSTKAGKNKTGWSVEMNQKQQERLYDEIQLAKDIFVRACAALMVTKNLDETSVAHGAYSSLKASKIFHDAKEKHIEELNKVNE